MPRGVSLSVSVPDQELVAGPRTHVWVHSRQRQSQDGTTDGINTRRAKIAQYYQILDENKWRRKGNRKEERLWPLVFNNFNILIEYQPFRDNADPTLDGMARARGATDIADKLFGRNTGRWAGRRISGSSWLLQGTARGKSLVMQITNSASLILMLKKWCGVVLAISQCVPSSVA